MQISPAASFRILLLKVQHRFVCSRPVQVLFAGILPQIIKDTPDTEILHFKNFTTLWGFLKLPDGKICKIMSELCRRLRDFR